MPLGASFVKIYIMPDITMCKGDGCPHKETCYRFTAEPSEFHQSYFVKSPFQQVEDEIFCPHYWDNTIPDF